MQVSVDLCLVPIGIGVSLSPYIAACQEVIKKKGLVFELGPNGTAIEGEWNAVFDCVRECYEVVHKLGSPRIYSVLKVNTRSDREQSFSQKVQSVTAAMSKKDLLNN